MKPNYIKIFTDIISMKFPQYNFIIDILKDKDDLTSLEVIEINNSIFGISKANNFKSYDLQSIKEILDYKEKNNLTIIATANHFRMSRNTLKFWINFMTLS